MVLDHHYQNAYVTRDLDRAFECFAEEFGFSGFQRFAVTYPLRTSAASGTATVKLALGWIGKVQYELIEPVAGLIDVYAADLPEQQLLRFHHVCMRVFDWDTLRAQLERERQRIVMEGGTPGQLSWLYVDARATLGHYVEYCWMTPERWTALGGV
jgi:hypothetical protein